ncbi:3-deoxy-8-phosphooctulonate synthase [Candidatus Binatus sp.]|uniref:3-deoxy-8-phosphooctulonate synthase n=1 Tax=Candidatus Binatus sp. TaxID=2811406 RepID=UPI00351D96D5
MTRVQAGNAVFGGPELVIIAGPCVIESYEASVRHAMRLAEITHRAGLPFVFKSSFDKANRTSHESYRGPGLEDGLEILARVKREAGVAVLTDIHEPEQAVSAAQVVDIIQIPALLSRQTDLIDAAAKTGCAVNIKKGQFLAPWDMKAVVAKAESAGTRRIILTERGFSFGYNNLVSDMRSLAIMRGFGYPVVFDATHSVQLPGAGAGGNRSGGQREFIAPLARAATAAGIDGVFMEVHEDPDRALSDGPNSYRLDELPALLETLKRIHEITREVR